MDPLMELLREKDDKNVQEVLSYDGKEIAAAVIALMSSHEIAQIVHWTLLAVSSTQEKRLLITESMLEYLQKRNITTTRKSAIISEIALDVTKYSPKELVKLTTFCIEAITQNKDEHKSWKELLPKLLSVAAEKEELLVSGVPKNGEEYKIDVLHTLCMGNWESKSLAALACMFVDIPMKPEEHLQVVNKLCSAIPDLVTDELPPLVHELLRLCKNGTSIILFVHLQEYFGDLIYSRNNNRPSSCDDILDDTRQSTRAEPAESTILFYINQSANMSRASIKDLIKTMKKLKSAPEKILEPFLVTALLSVTNISTFKSQVLEVLKQAVVTVVLESEKKAKSAWIQSNIPEECDINNVLSAVINCSVRVRESVVKGLILLAFALINTPVSAKIKEPAAEKLWSYGNHVIVQLLKHQSEDLGVIILNQINISIKLKQSVKQHINCLQAISMNSPLTLIKNEAIIISLMEHFVYMEDEAALDLVNALLPGIRHFQHLKDNIIVILRKALYSRMLETRVVTTTSFLLLLKHFKISSMGVLSQSSQSSSQSTSRARVMYSKSRPYGMGSSDSICLEILGVLRRCLIQQVEVKQALFTALGNSVGENPELLSYVEDILVHHLMEYVIDNEAVLPPFDFNKVAVIKDLSVVVKEPLGHLLFACQQVITQDSSGSLSRSGIKLQEILDSLMNRMAKCTLEEFELTDATELLDTLPENCQKQEMVKQMLGVYEALMAYVLSSWTIDTSDHSKKLVSLFKGYNRLAEFCKSSNKMKKNDNAEAGDKRSKSLKSINESRKRGTSGKSLVFKFPASLWDFPTTQKMLELIYKESVEWCPEDVMNQTRSHRELRRYAIQVASQLVKHSQSRKVTRDTYRYSLQLGKLLYQKVVCKLLDEIEYDHTAAIVALECFLDLLNLMCSYPDVKKQCEFINQVVGSDQEPLMEMITAYENLLRDVLDQEEDKDEPGIKKIPQFLISSINVLVSHYSTVGLSADLDKIYDWVKTFATDTTIANDQAASAILELLLNLHIRCKTFGSVFDNVTLQLYSLIGTHLPEEKDIKKPYTKLAIVSKSTRNSSLLLLCTALTDTLLEVQWMVNRFQSEYLGLNYPGKTTYDERRDKLKAKERAVCLHISYTINVIIYLCAIDLENMPTPIITLLRLLLCLYTNITGLTRYFFMRSTKVQPAFQAARFEHLVKLCGKELSRSVNEFIVHIENCCIEDNKGKKKEVDPLLLKMRVLREEKIIPKVTFEKEQFEKWLIKLSKKTKVDLMEHVKASGARDFRIRRSELKSGLENQNISMDTTEPEGDGEANDKDASEDQPKRKKPRSK